MEAKRKKEYRKPELETAPIELGVFGSYGGGDDCHDGGRRRGRRGSRRGGWIGVLGWPFDE